MPEPKPTRFGKYLLLEKIAAGGMAQLYRAKITGVQGFEKLIAIKMILPHLLSEKELISSFIDEAKLAALLIHHNIVQIYDFGQMENSYYIAMEYLSGRDLRHIYQKSKERKLPLNVEQTLYIISRICSGLDYAHKLKDFQGKPLNIIHRDISPQNVFITYEGEVKILDFGIAKAASQSTVTQHGMIKGKVAYMSPEQASGKKIDPRSDIFSTGILLYEMLTQRRMFTGDTMQILAKVREAEFEPPEAAIQGLPPKLYRILHLALAKEPEERYQACGEMLSDLEECMFELSLRPTARGLAQYMRRLFEEEIEAEGGTTGEVAAAVPEEGGKDEEELPALEKAPTWEAPVEAEPRKPGKRGFLYAAAAVAAAVIIAIFVFWPKEKSVLPPGKEEVPALRPGLSKEPPSAEVPSADTAKKTEKAGDLHPPPAKVPPADSVKKTEKAADLQPPPAKAPSADSVKKPEKVADLRAEALGLQEQAVRVMKEKPEEARSLLLKAVQLDPKSSQAHFRLGLTYSYLKDSPRAIEAYQKAIELNPQFADAYFNLGYIYAMDKDYPKAEEMYGQVVKLAPPYLDEALFNLGMVQDRLGKRVQSIDNLERALKVNPQNAAARKFLDQLKGEAEKR